MTPARRLIEENPHTTAYAPPCRRITELFLILQSLDREALQLLLIEALPSLALQTPNSAWWTENGPALETRVVTAIRQAMPKGFLFEQENGSYHFSKQVGTDIVDLSSFA